MRPVLFFNSPTWSVQGCPSTFKMTILCWRRIWIHCQCQIKHLLVLLAVKNRLQCFAFLSIDSLEAVNIPILGMGKGTQTQCVRSVGSVFRLSFFFTIAKWNPFIPGFSCGQGLWPNRSEAAEMIYYRLPRMCMYMYFLPLKNRRKSRDIQVILVAKRVGNIITTTFLLYWMRLSKSYQ